MLQLLKRKRGRAGGETKRPIEVITFLPIFYQLKADWNKGAEVLRVFLMLKRSADTVGLEKVGVFSQQRPGIKSERNVRDSRRIATWLLVLASLLLSFIPSQKHSRISQYRLNILVPPISLIFQLLHLFVLSSLAPLPHPAAGLKASRAAIFKAYAKSAPQRGWMHEGAAEREMGRRQRGKKFWTMAACVRLPGTRLATIYVTSTTTVLIAPSLFHSHPLLLSSVQFLLKNPPEMTRSAISLERVKST